MLGKLLEKITTLAVLAALAWAAWYVYSHWTDTSSGTDSTAQETGFNCRQAVAKLAQDYACRNSDSCTLTSDELTDMKNREVDIEKYCN